MKTKKEIEKEIGFKDVVFDSKEWLELAKCNCFNAYDGEGYFHDGEHETELSVFDRSVTEETFNKYPYVCWYNK